MIRCRNPGQKNSAFNGDTGWDGNPIALKKTRRKLFLSAIFDTWQGNRRGDISQRPVSLKTTQSRPVLVRLDLILESSKSTRNYFFRAKDKIGYTRVFLRQNRVYLGFSWTKSGIGVITCGKVRGRLSSRSSVWTKPGTKVGTKTGTAWYMVDKIGYFENLVLLGRADRRGITYDTRVF